MSVVRHNVRDMRNVSRVANLLPSRPAKEAVTEIVGVSVLGLFIVFALGAFPGGNEGVHRALSLAPMAGSVLLQHIGWTFGAYIPILLGFYAIVIGGQLVGDPATAARTRRDLGFVAEAMTGALVPALVLIFVACITDPSQAGVLFVIIPVAAVMFFLAIQLGGFIVFEHELRLVSAERSRDWAKRRLDMLRKRSRKPLWLVVILHCFIGCLIAVGTTLIIRPTASVSLVVVMYGLIALGLTLGSVHGVYAVYTGRDRANKVMALLVPSGLYLAVFLIAVEVFMTLGTAVGVSVLAVLAFLAVSTLWPRRSAPRFLLNWTIQGGGAGYAAKSISSTYVHNVREIRKLSAMVDADASPNLRDRMAAALQALRGAAAGRTV